MEVIKNTKGSNYFDAIALFYFFLSNWGFSNCPFGGISIFNWAEAMKKESAIFDSVFNPSATFKGCYART